jgi:hypothetical protein
MYSEVHHASNPHEGLGESAATCRGRTTEENSTEAT